MNRNICKKAIFKVASISILAVLFYTVCDDNSVNVVTPEVTTFEDKRDGKVYKKVKIGSQIWMAENLRYEADGSVCTDGGWMHLDTNQSCEEYGRLYDWNTAMDGERSSHANPSGVEGVCPVGWHLPSDAEWTELIDYVGENAGTKLKARSWHDIQQPGGRPVPDGTDKYRFTALPGGYASYTGGRLNLGTPGYTGGWWSSTEMESHNDEAWLREIQGVSTGVLRWHFEKHYFLSVRCVHD